MMANYFVHELSIPAPNHNTLLEYSARLKALRLRSLKEETQSFSSSYDSEVKQPRDFWLDRLNNDKAIHLILVRDNPDRSKTDLSGQEWVGFVVMVKPESAQDGSLRGSPNSPWKMNALYVAPEARGHGLGQRLVKASFDKIKEEAGGSAYYETSVLHGNENALRMYLRLGFHVVDPNEHWEKEGRDIAATKIGIMLKD
jgi:ribosomal protein S18 acetylase RimI-like enzyme